MELLEYLFPTELTERNEVRISFQIGSWIPYLPYCILLEKDPNSYKHDTY